MAHNSVNASLGRKYSLQDVNLEQALQLLEAKKAKIQVNLSHGKSEWKQKSRLPRTVGSAKGKKVEKNGDAPSRAKSAEEEQDTDFKEMKDRKKEISSEKKKGTRLNGYQKYVKKNYTSIKEELPVGSSLAMVSGVLGQRWKILSDEERQKYNEMTLDA